MSQPPQYPQQPQYGQPQYQQQQPQYQQGQYQQGEYPQQGGWDQQPAWQSEPPRPTGTNGFAIAALIFGILGGILFAVIFGIIGLVQTKRTGQKGRGLAVAGLVLSGLWIAGIATVIAIAVSTSADRDANGQLTNGGSVAATELKVGDCLNGLEDGKEFSDVPAVPCAKPHEGEVYAVFNISGTSGSWPGESTVAKKAEEGCNQRLKTFAPKAVEDSKISLFSLQPTSATWARGDREVTCVAVSSTPQTGSIKD